MSGCGRGFEGRRSRLRGVVLRTVSFSEFWRKYLTDASNLRSKLVILTAHGCNRLACSSTGRSSFRLFFPSDAFPKPPHDVHQSQQDRNFDERADGGRQSLVAACAIRRNGNRDGKLEVVARTREALCCCEPIPEAKTICHKHSQAEDAEEVDYQRRGHADDRDHLMHHPMALRCEQYKDGVQEADQRKGCHPLQELVVVPRGADQHSDPQPCHDRCSERYAKEDGYTCCDCGVGDRNGARRAADDFDEEDCERCIEHHLEDGVDGDENCTILAVASRKSGPDEHLGQRVSMASNERLIIHLPLLYIVQDRQG